MLEFAQPAALWTGLAISLPIIAHMAYRRVTKKYAFPSLRFIRPSSIPRTGKKTPSDIPLLLLRILFFVLLVCLLADPYWNERVSAENDSNKEEIILAIDLSPSMTGGNALEEAKELALGILNQNQGNTGLLAYGNGGLQEWPAGTDVDLLKTGVAKLEHGWKKGDAQIMLERAPSLFSRNASRKKLVIISDFQRGDWQSAFRDLSALGVDFKMLGVGKGDKMGGRSANRSVVEARAVPAGPGKIRVWAVVRNWEDKKIDVKLSLWAGGEERENKRVSLSPLGSAQGQFLLPAGDFSTAMIRLNETDFYPLDDNRTISLAAPPAKRFGFWYDQSNHPETAEESEFLRNAVLSSGDSGWNRWQINQDNADAIRMGDSQAELEFLMILGMESWFQEENLGPEFLEFLEQGGSALVTPGERFSSTSSIFNQNNLMEFSFLRVAGGANFNSVPFRIAALESGSPLEQVFSGKSARDLYLTSIQRFGILKNIDESLVVPVQDREGRPLAVIRNFKTGGRLVFLTFRLSSKWTDLPLRNSFLPLIMELTKSTVSSSSTTAWPILEPGDSWGEEDTFSAKIPGIYRFQEQLLEVILSPVESSPDIFENVEIEQALGGQFKDLKSPSPQDGWLENNDQSLWLWFAIAATILLIIEMLWSRPQLDSSANPTIKNA
ncbi:MAG: hypothetical protein CMI27_01880 [Opitutae bacterium]|nr:hypothetical protein [Opitutae bacterium]